MTLAQKVDEIRKGLLFELHRIGRIGRPAERLHQLVNAGVVPCDVAEISEALAYLEGKALVSCRRASGLSAGLPDIWFITSNGIDFVERDYQA